MSFGDMALGGVIGYSLGSSSTTVRKVKRSREDQIALIINLPIDDVGIRFAKIFESGVITDVDENDEYNENRARRCLIAYDKEYKIFKYAQLEDKYGEKLFSGVIGKELVLKYKYGFAKVTKLGEKRTILTVKIYTSDGFRRFDEDELILIFEAFKDFIDSDDIKGE